MSLSARARMLVGFATANAVILAVLAAILLNRPASPPLIQGVLLADGRALEPFSLLDHRGEPFTNRDLHGQWHLVSYGFTTCPDICPTTLSQLADAKLRLAENGDDLQVLFYSVDHRRDTVSQLASYLPFFDEEFVGLTHLDDPQNPHLPFEQGLGIVAQLVPNLDQDGGQSANDYQVVHGVTLFLLNPAGELQAIFEPDESLPGMHSYDPDKLVSDYLAVRRYLEG